eukprot:TRINITY_DN4112_c0_g2_i1.p1 TRINITY_DN4112_c0_g2~~TRINITY_DN4112_c0_g2_i1.p1  ORF type:complete len:248 (+),score=22.47 TRINITY_DN4112_c0_g2_i1:262-1005(+)
MLMSQLYRSRSHGPTRAILSLIPLLLVLTSTMCIDIAEPLVSSLREDTKRGIVQQRIDDLRRDLNIGRTDAHLFGGGAGVGDVSSIRLGTEFGSVDIALFDSSPTLKDRIRDMVQSGHCVNTGEACNFYRAEAAPSNFGKDGFFGPPYALLQGVFGDGRRDWDIVSQMRPLVSAWDVCLIGKGPSFFIALADHHEWGNGHIVFGRVTSQESRRSVLALADQPVHPETWGQTPVTALDKKIGFSIALN